ncbi:Arc family DNA-binding protein [Acinetobacter gerneri]|uniref:Arc family DNA-binding protein n=1 Tax=Acinetobacter gerneri TaxID=202952 RepID=UPI003AF984DD
MSNQADHTIVRLRVPPELKQKIEKSAEGNNRSQSSEMVARLEQSFSYDEKLPSIALEYAKQALLNEQNWKKGLKMIMDLQDQVEKQNKLIEKLDGDKQK